MKIQNPQRAKTILGGGGRMGLKKSGPLTSDYTTKLQ